MKWSLGLRLCFLVAAPLAALLLVGCSSAVVEEGPETSSPATTSGDPSPDSGAPVPCHSDEDCQGNAICAFDDGLCGATTPGVCVENGIFTDCGGGYPSCTCDGIFEPTGCGSFGGFGANGESYSSDHSCFPTFACGSQTCTHTVDYCASGPDGSACQTLPVECGPYDPHCPCFGELDPGCSCAETADGDFFISCASQ